MSYVVVDQPRAGVTRLTLNRPDRLNALTAPLVRELHAALDAIEPRTRVVVLTGAGRGFCAGLDLGGYDEGAAAPSPAASLAVQRDIAGVMQKLRRLHQPVVAAVNGAAAGGGLALVCASDVRIAADSAVFASSFIKVGFSGCDMGVSWLLPRLVGAGRAHELMLTARRFDADEALKIGLLADVVAPAALAERVDALVDELLAAPPLSLALTKQGMWLSVEIPSFDAAVELENRQQVITAMTAEQSEAMAAFLEHRAPVYEPR